MNQERCDAIPKYPLRLSVLLCFKTTKEYSEKLIVFSVDHGPRGVQNRVAKADERFWS